MSLKESDRAWEQFGKEDPYFGVLTDEKFRKSNLTDAAKEEFFRSGEDYIADVLAKVHRYIDPTFNIRNALDFGCGVGRLVIPLASIADEVTGIDISPSMLAEARNNYETRNLQNVSLVLADDALSLVNQTYDFVHSFIVFQHIPVPRGEKIFRRLVSKLEAGGVGVVHFTYAKAYVPSRKRVFVQTYVPFGKNLLNLRAGKKFSAPEMQMNPYNLNEILVTMQTAGVTACHVEFTDHDKEFGVVVYFKKGISLASGNAVTSA